MIDKKKVKLMTRMASYENNEGKKDLKITGYYRNDYIGLHSVYTILWVTIGYVCLMALFGISMLDRISLNLSLTVMFLLLGVAVIGYVIAIALYVIATHLVYGKRYDDARDRVRKYNHDLSRLIKIYEKEKE